MKVNSIKTTQPRYNKTQQNTNYMTPNNSQSFGTKWLWGNSSKKVVTTAVEAAKSKVLPLANRPLSIQAPDIDFVTVPLYHRLNAIEDSFGATADALGKKYLVEKYVQFPNARETMLRAANSEFSPEIRGGLYYVDSCRFNINRLKELFGDNYVGSDSQNRIVQKIVDSQYLGSSKSNYWGRNIEDIERGIGSFRFPLGMSTEEIFSSPEKEKAFELLVDKKLTIESSETDYQKLADAFLYSPEKYGELSKNAVTTSNSEIYWINDQQNFEPILKQINSPKALSYLEKLIQRVKPGDKAETVANLNNSLYREIFLNRGFELMDKGHIQNLEELNEIVSHAAGPFALKTCETTVKA